MPGGDESLPDASTDLQARWSIVWAAINFAAVVYLVILRGLVPNAPLAVDALLAVSVVLQLWLRIRVTSDVTTSQSVTERSELQPEISRQKLADLVDTAKRHAPWQHIIFIELLVQYASRSRINESLHIENDFEYERVVETMWRIGEELGEPEGAEIFVPVLTPPKGELLSRLEVRDSDGALIPLLPYFDAFRLCIACWEQIVVSLFNVTSETAYRESRELHSATQAGIEIIGLTPKSPSSNRNLMLSEKLADGLIERWERSLPANIQSREQHVELAKSYLRIFATRYALVGTITFRKTLVVTHRYFISSDMKPSRLEDHTRWRVWINSLRRILGVPTSNILAIDLAQAQAADSYHFNLTVPRGNYIASAIVKSVDGRALTKEPKAPHVNLDPYFRKSPIGYRYLHLYCRGFRSSSTRPVVHIAVFEPPWTTLTLAVAYSALCVTLLSLLQHAQTSIDPFNAVLTVVGLPVSVVGVVLAFRDSRSGRSIARSVTGVLISLLSSVLFADGVLAFLDRTARWFEIPRASAPHWLPTREGVLSFDVRVELLLLILGIAFAIVRYITWWRNVRPKKSQAASLSVLHSDS